MTGLADAYGDDVGALQSPLRLKAGAALLAAGTVLGLAALVAVLFAPTDYGARRIAGVLGGLAAPMLVGGVVVILPASPRLRAASAIGASVTLLGVASFWYAYPQHWAGYGRDLTGYVTAVYFLGVVTLVCCCFAGIATLKRRNDPGGTVSLQVGQGETKVVKVRERVDAGLGGVGLLGGTPEGDVETQTNRPDRNGSGSSSERSGTKPSSSSRGGRGSTSGRTRTSSSRNDGGSTTDGSSFGIGDSSDDGGLGSADHPSSSSDLDSRTRSKSGGGLDSGGSDSGQRGGPSAGRTTSEPRGAVSDGGATTDPVRDVEPAADAGSGGTRRGAPDVADRYCGNCEHFQYARTESGMTPYCALNSEYMEDVEACEDWSPNA